jgi:C4-dicarboxylate-specific signal transduction histidine kinase
VVRIKFGDTGCGIGSKDPTDVFLPFYSTKKGWGTNLGLGLSISYNIVAKHGGNISVRNKKNRGCEFELTFPAAEG